MGQLRRGPRLDEEALARDRVDRLSREQQLDSDPAIEAKLAREEHHAHAASAKTALERVTTGQRTVEQAEMGIRFS